MKTKVSLFRITIFAVTIAFICPAICIPMNGTAGAQTDERGARVRPAETTSRWPTGAKRFALIIGVDEYQDRQINRLLGASNDAKALSDALVRYAGFPKEQVVLLSSDQPIHGQPTRANILRQLVNLRQAAPKDGLLLVSFAGHGFERDGRAYLLPMDAQASEDIALLEESAINVETMRDHIRQTGIGQVVIILDACRNNPLSGRSQTSTPLTNAYVRGFDFDVRNREVAAFATIYSTGVGQLAYEDKDRKQGYFTLAMVEGLKGGAVNYRGEVTLAGLVDFVQQAVPKRTAIAVGNRQKPFAVIEGYKANDLVISVPSLASLTNPDAQTERPSATPAKPLLNNPIKPVLARYEERGVLIELNLCKMEGNIVTCEFTLENQSESYFDIWLFTTDYYNVGSRIYDESNQSYKSSSIRFGNKDNAGRDHVSMLAVPHLKINAAIKFQGFNPTASSISLLQVLVGVADPDKHIYGDLDRTFKARMGGKITIAK